MAASTARIGFKATASSKQLRAAPVAAKCPARFHRDVATCSLKSFAESAGQVAAAVAASAALATGAANALTYDEFNSLTYMQVKGTGLANTCSTLAGGDTEVSIPSGTYMVDKFCMELTEFLVKEEGEFQDTKLMTRMTYTLDGITGSFDVAKDGTVKFVEEDGIDYAATTVQLAGGERVPFLFTVKELVASGDLSAFGGDFTVPSYRGSSFLDPKGRGGSTGYDTAVALPAGSDLLDEELAGENIKSAAALKGTVVFNIAKYDSVTGEIAGLFTSVQPSDTDLGAKAPKDVKISGLWYGQLSN